MNKFFIFMVCLVCFMFWLMAFACIIAAIYFGLLIDPPHKNAGIFFVIGIVLGIFGLGFLQALEDRK